MANQTVTTGTIASPLNYDHPSISPLLNGESITINGGAVRIDSDVRWNQQAAVFGELTISSTLGGALLIDGRDVWEIPFSASTGTVPAQITLGGNGVVGGTSGATGELLRVWATGSLEPAAAGGAMPATGWIKLRSKTGTFQTGETITLLVNGATITASGPGKRSWIHVVGAEERYFTLPRLGTFSVDGDWYELGTTNGADNQTFQFPVLDECVAVQVETAPGSNLYEWWFHGAMRWNNNVASEPALATFSGVSATYNNIQGPQGALAGGQYSLGTRLRETATTSTHGTSSSVGANQVAAGTLIYRTWIKKETRRYVLVQAHSGTARFGALVDLDTGTIIANPTVGSPTGTSSTIQSVGSGWYGIELTLNHAMANSCSINIYAANSAAPTYDASGFPTYLGLTTEGFYYSEAQIVHSTLQQIPTDKRGTFFFSDATTGLLTFAKRDAQYNAGFKPPSGCRVRIPNVIVSSSVAGDWSRNTLNSTPVSRAMRFNTGGGGAITVRNAIMNITLLPGNPSLVTLENSAIALQAFVNNAANQVTMNNFCVGLSRSITPPSQGNGFALYLTNCVGGTAITDAKFAHGYNASSVAQFASCKSLSLNNFSLYSFANNFTNRRTNNNALSVSSCNEITFNNFASVGSGLFFQSANNVTINNLKYAHVMIEEQNQLFGQYAVVATTSDTFLLDGFTSFENLPHIHPYAGILSVSALCNNVEMRNVGTAAAPYDAGTVNPMGVLAAMVGISTNVTLRRVYGQNLRTSAVSTIETAQNLKMYNVWADANDSQVMLARNALSQGCRWTNPSTAQSAVYGTHWEDAFVSTTDGRLMISANEPTSETADQCVGTFSGNAGFTSTGSVSLPGLTDTVTWTMPYYALGHTGIAKFTSGVFTNPWFVTGNNVQYLEFDYQIDTGAGFSAWKHLLNQGRRAAGGGVGTNTVTLITAERTAMLRQPQIGDYVQSGSNRLPHGTTITNVSGDVLTLSNNFASSAGANEPILIWRDIANETINSATGYKLKVRVKVNTASSTNSMSFLRIPFDTTSVAQQTQYPLPTNLNVAEVTNIVAGSRLRVYNVTTATEITNEVMAGTSWSLEYAEGSSFSEGDTIQIRVRKPGYLPYQATAVAGETGWALFVSQTVDDIYSATTPINTTIDYVNLKIRATGARASFSAIELVDIIRVGEATLDGIRLERFAEITGLVELSAGIFTAITVELLDWQVSWAAGSVTQATLTGGNIVGGISGDPVEDIVGGPQITVQQSADATVVAVGSGVLPGDITAIAAAVRAELTVEMNRIDVAVSSRLAAASYTAAPSAAANAAAVLAAAQTTPIQADIRKVNDITVDGVGTEADPFGPA